MAPVSCNLSNISRSHVLARVSQSRRQAGVRGAKAEYSKTFRYELMSRCYAVAGRLNGIRRPYEPNPAMMVEDEIKTTDILHLSSTTAYIGFFL